MTGAEFDRLLQAARNDPAKVELIVDALNLNGENRRVGNPGKPDKRRIAIRNDASRKYFGHAPVSIRRLAQHIDVSRPTIAAWRRDSDYQEEVRKEARDFMKPIQIIGIKPRSTFIGIRPAKNKRARVPPGGKLLK